MSFEKIAKDIKSLKIQGAENIAQNALYALRDFVKKIKPGISNSKFITEVERAKDILFKLRSTEPCLRNSINYAIHNLNDSSISNLRQHLNQNIDGAIKHFKMSNDTITTLGARKIKNSSKIFTHCHSNTVMSILKQAKKNGKKFEVHNTETRPMYQGRITARELAKAKIPVIHYVDSAARLAIKHADLMIIGCDAVDSEGKCYNKIGSEMYAEIANKFDIPVYVATDSWKFDPKTIFGYNEEIERRSPKEIWPGAPKQIKIQNLAFEKIDSGLVTGIISELGVFKPEIFIEEIKSNNKFMFI